MMSSGTSAAPPQLIYSNLRKLYETPHTRKFCRKTRLLCSRIQLDVTPDILLAGGSILYNYEGHS